MMDFERQDSRKRRRLSERRRVFGRIGLNNTGRTTALTEAASGGGGGGGSLSSDQSWSSSSQQQQPSATNQTFADLSPGQQSSSSRSDSPLSEGSRISMKIQFHITVAPEHEPLILDPSSLTTPPSPQVVPQTPTALHHPSGPSNPQQRQKSTDSAIGEHIQERLSRQNTLSTRRRQQLLAMHNNMALNNNGELDSPRARANSARCESTNGHGIGATATATTTPTTTRRANGLAEDPWAAGGRDTGARASTITGGLADEATVKFLAQQQLQQRPVQPAEREHIYFKRDGQRFGHEFTLKLAVDRTYRCLIKIRPLIPLQAISIQGHHVMFADCSQTSSGAAAVAAAATSATGNTIATPSSAPASSSALNRSWQDIRNHNLSHHSNHHHHNHHHHHQRHPQNSNHHRLNHAQTTSNLTSRTSMLNPSFNRANYLYQQQQNQMMRYFSASHCSSTSNSHLGSQLIYMFDWSASRFEVNKNKARTQVQTVLKFKNGQILSLPLQVKFYQSECRQHLSWGSQLHFIDYDCNINSMGQISVERVHYY